MPNTILSPDGRQWQVRRRLVPRLGAETLPGRIWRRMKDAADHATTGVDVGSGCVPGSFSDLAVLAVALVLLAAVIFIVIPLLAAIVDLVILLLLAVLGILARVVFRRPWVVEAAASDGQRHQWRVVGWRRSGERCREIARSLAAGVVPPPDTAGP
ncbi:MAG: hypothetical protein R2761_23210 [Acidimicrobiales bacterium]